MRLPAIRHASIRARLFLMITLCWVVPLCILCVYIFTTFQKEVRNRLEGNVQAQLSQAMNLVSDRLDNLNALSRNASRDTTIDDALLEYEQNRVTGVVLDNLLTAYLHKNYYNPADIAFAAFVPADVPDTVYYTSAENYAQYTNYQTFDHADIMDRAAHIDHYMGYYVSGRGELYLIRNLMRYSYDDSRWKTLGTLILKPQQHYLFGSLSDNDGWLGNMTIQINDAALRLGAGRIPADAPIRSEMNGSADHISRKDRETLFTGTEQRRDFTLRYGLALDNNLLYGEFDELRNMILSMLFIIMPLFVVFIVVFSRSITRPIRKLVKASQSLATGDLGLQVYDIEDNEFHYLSDTFNAMSAQLKTLFENAYNEKLAARDAKITALQAQINPHFLNNTLELMNWEARMGNNAAVSEMIEALSVMLDASMNREGRQTVTVREELGYARAYLTIISSRYGTRLSIEVDADETLYDEELPSLVIQPLLENAVVHGVEPSGKGDIKLSVKREEGMLAITVTNGGSPLSEKDKAAVRRLLANETPADEVGQGGRLGIRNVYMRLRLLYEGRAAFTIDEQDGRTRARVAIPLKDKNNPENEQ